MPLTELELGHLVAATLSVNGYGVARAAALLPALRERGLLDPAKVLTMSYDGLVETLAVAGYSRGGFLPILSHRVAQLMEASRTGRLDGLPSAVMQDDRRAFEVALRSVHGWGPVTIDAAWSSWRQSLEG